MSRDYDEFCKDCVSSQARSQKYDNMRLYQCTNCGVCWVIVSHRKNLQVKGITNEIWKKAEKEMYNKVKQWN